MTVDAKTTTTSVSDAPEVARLRKVTQDLHSLRMTAGVYDRDDVQHVLSLVDALTANVAEKERIMHRLAAMSC